MEIEVLLELIVLILTQKGRIEDFVEDIIKKNFVLDRETLFVATQMRQIELVRFVLKSGVKPTLETFQYAAEHDFFELCRLFVEFGSRKILSTPELETELKTNLLDGHIENFKNLINRGIDPTTEDNFVIQWTFELGHLEIVSLLLKHGADPTAKDNYAIRRASRQGYLEIVQLLLDNDADPTADDNAAIKMASMSGHLEVVRLLLNNKSKYKVNPKAGDNFAIKSASGPDKIEIIKLLKRYRAKL